MPRRAEQRPEILSLAEFLMSGNVGEIISYPDMSSAIKINVTDVRNRWIIGRARHLLNQQYGAIFAPVRGQGLRRLAAWEGANYTGERSLLRIRSAARAGSARLRNVVQIANDLTPAQSRMANARLSALGLIEHLTMSRTVASLPEDDLVADEAEAMGNKSSNLYSELVAALGRDKS